MDALVMFYNNISYPFFFFLAGPTDRNDNMSRAELSVDKAADQQTRTGNQENVDRQHIFGLQVRM